MYIILDKILALSAYGIIDARLLFKQFISLLGTSVVAVRMNPNPDTCFWRFFGSLLHCDTDMEILGFPGKRIMGIMYHLQHGSRCWVFHIDLNWKAIGGLICRLLRLRPPCWIPTSDPSLHGGDGWSASRVFVPYVPCMFFNILIPSHGPKGKHIHKTKTYLCI